MCTGVIRVVDAKYSPTLSVRSFPGSTSLYFSLEFTCTTGPKLSEQRTGGNLVKIWVIPLSWDFLVSTLTHPSKDFTLLPSSGLRSTMWAISLALLQRG